MILMRHGQSEWNVIYAKTRVDPGMPDPGLTEEGRRQAAEAGRALAQRGIKRLIASPYRRTLETAAILAERLSLGVTIEPLVREHCKFGCDVGSHRSVLAQDWPHLDFSDLPERWWPDLDETEEQVLDRARAFRAAMAEREDWSATAVVSHWGFIRLLTGAQLGNGELLHFDPIADRAQPLGG